MNTPLGDEPSIRLSGDDKAVALLEAIRAISEGNRDEVQAARTAYNALHKAPQGLKARGLLVLDAGSCIITPGYALQMHRQEFKRLARKTDGYCLEDETYVRNLLIEKLTILVKSASPSLGKLISEYGILLDWELDQAEQKRLQLA